MSGTNYVEVSEAVSPAPTNLAQTSPDVAQPPLTAAGAGVDAAQDAARPTTPQGSISDDADKAFALSKEQTAFADYMLVSVS